MSTSSNIRRSAILVPSTPPSSRRVQPVDGPDNASPAVGTRSASNGAISRPKGAPASTHGRVLKTAKPSKRTVDETLVNGFDMEPPRRRLPKRPPPPGQTTLTQYAFLSQSSNRGSDTSSPPQRPSSASTSQVQATTASRPRGTVIVPETVVGRAGRSSDRDPLAGRRSLTNSQGNINPFDVSGTGHKRTNSNASFRRASSIQDTNSGTPHRSRNQSQTSPLGKQSSILDGLARTPPATPSGHRLHRRERSLSAVVLGQPLSHVPMTPEQRKARLRESNARLLGTPDDILAGLARSPTPTKKAPAPHPLSMAKRRLAYDPDDESYRPHQRRQPPSTPEPRPPTATRRSRRVQPQPGKYTVPAIDVPWEQWPTTAGVFTSPASTASAKRRKTSLPATPPSAARPQRGSTSRHPSTTPKRKEMQPSSPLSPYPATQHVVRHEDETTEGSCDAEDAAQAEKELDPLEEFAFFNEMEFSPEMPKRTSLGPNTPSRHSESGLRSVGPTPSRRSLPQTPSRSSLKGQRLSASPLTSRHSLSPSASVHIDRNGTTSQMLTTSDNAPHSQSRHLERAAMLSVTAEPVEDAEVTERRSQPSTVRFMADIDEEDEPEITLSQIMRSAVPNGPRPDPQLDKSVSPVPRRSLRSKQATRPESPETPPATPKRVLISKRKDASQLAFEQLVREGERDKAIGATPERLAALMKEGHPAEEPDDPAAIDYDVLHEDIQRELVELKALEQEAHPEDLLPCFWNDLDHNAAQRQASYVEHTAELRFSLPVGLSDAQRHLHAAFSVVCEDTAWLAYWHLLNVVEQSEQAPFEDAADMMAFFKRAWQYLGAKGEVLSPEEPAVVIARDRQLASVMICGIVNSLLALEARTGLEYWFIEDITELAQLMVLLLADPTTTPALSDELVITLNRLLAIAAPPGDDTKAIATLLAAKLDDLSPQHQLRAVLRLGQGAASSRSVAQWLAIVLLCGDVAIAQESTVPSIDLLCHIIEGLVEDISPRPNDLSWRDVLARLSFWPIAIGDFEEVFAAGTKRGEEVKQLVVYLERLDHYIPQSNDNETLHRLGTFVKLAGTLMKVQLQRCQGMARSRQLSGRGLEAGHGPQTRLSFGK